MAPYGYGYDDPPGDDKDESVALLLLDEMVEAYGSPGRILPGAAKKAPCRCVTIESEGGAKKICNRMGILGTLTQEQVGNFCSSTKEVKDGRKERIAVMRATGECKQQVPDLTKAHALDDYLDCVGEILHREHVDVRG